MQARVARAVSEYDALPEFVRRQIAPPPGHPRLLQALRRQKEKEKEKEKEKVASLASAGRAQLPPLDPPVKPLHHVASSAAGPFFFFKEAATSTLSTLRGYY
jgi:hypothetical protein